MVVPSVLVSFQSINIPNEWGFGLPEGVGEVLFTVSNQLISPTSGDFSGKVPYRFTRSIEADEVSNQLISPTSGDPLNGSLFGAYAEEFPIN